MKSACTQLPRHVAVATGMDAVTHAIESYVLRGANPITEMSSLEALRILVESLPAVCERPEDLHVREMMLLRQLSCRQRHCGGNGSCRTSSASL